MEEYINLIRKIAWSYHKSTGIEWDELFQECVLIYYHSLQSYNPKRGRFTTHLWYSICSNLNNYLKKEALYKERIVSIEDVQADIPVSYADFSESLTKEAQEIAEIIIASSKKYLWVNPEHIQQRIENIMLCRGWSSHKIHKGIEDLKQACVSI